MASVSDVNLLEVESSVNGVVGSDGMVIPIDSLTQTLGYTSGDLTSISVTYGGNTYVQTLTYSSGVLSTISGWVKQ